MLTYFFIYKLGIVCANLITYRKQQTFSSAYSEFMENYRVTETCLGFDTIIVCNLTSLNSEFKYIKTQKEFNFN